MVVHIELKGYLQIYTQIHHHARFAVKREREREALKSVWADVCVCLIDDGVYL